jgi:hypothetical protein
VCAKTDVLDYQWGGCCEDSVKQTTKKMVEQQWANTTSEIKKDKERTVEEMLVTPEMLADCYPTNNYPVYKDFFVVVGQWSCWLLGYETT